MKTKQYIPKIGDRVRVVECWGGRSIHVGGKGNVHHLYNDGTIGVDFGDRKCLAAKVEPVKRGRPKKASPKKEVRQLPSERIKEIYKKLTANTYVDPNEFAIDAIIKYLDEQHKEENK